MHQEPLVQVFDIPHELPKHRADGREIRPLLKPDDGEAWADLIAAMAKGKPPPTPPPLPPALKAARDQSRMYPRWDAEKKGSSHRERLMGHICKG